MTHSRKRSLAETGARPLLSHTSILIISIFVLGMATGTTSTLPADSTYLMMGVFGLISYFGLGALAATRERKLRKQELEQKEEALEGRLERHLSKDTQTNTPQRVAVNGVDQSSQYQTVNTTAGVFRNRY
ncbi:MAG: hypothetical protein KDA70_01440 [Planctomycetaceae bacterium]|nr:hypothetical protein [Planctomycetaceae bacterium]MCA9019337.1 hypothetical protein [Planctomycetaceae bacterium]